MPSNSYSSFGRCNSINNARLSSKKIILNYVSIIETLFQVKKLFLKKYITEYDLRR